MIPNLYIEKDYPFFERRIFDKKHTVDYNFYKIIEDQYNLIEFNDNLSIAHLAQLFSLLEIKIRELGALLNIVPFKIKTSEFFHYNDPSTILIEILLEAYRVTSNYETVIDLLFVYIYMYNSNSLNIRNECIRGRDYLDKNSMSLAFKITLFSIYYIIHRIEIINSSNSI